MIISITPKVIPVCITISQDTHTPTRNSPGKSFAIQSVFFFGIDIETI